VIRQVIRISGLSVATLLAVASLSAQTGSRLWTPEERTLITDFSVVDAVAADENMLYVVSRAGIGVYDRRSMQWQHPVTVLDGYVPQPAAAALIDPSDGSLWIATASAVVHYSPRMRLLETVPVAGGVSQLVIDRSDPFAGVYVRGRSGWMFLPRGGVIPQPTATVPQTGNLLRAARIAEILRRYPNIETMRSGVLVDDRLRSHRFTSAAEVRLTADVFLGTDGLGVVRYDAQTTDFEPMPFGLLTEGAMALAVVPEGVWVAGDDRSPRSGFTLVSSDLQRFEHEEGSSITGLRLGRVRDLVSSGGRLWAASEAALVTVEQGMDPMRITTVDGLPADRVLSLASAPDGVWVGTQRGLAFVSDGGTVERIGQQLFAPVLSLASSGAAVWVGTRSGLALSWAGTDRVVVPPDAQGVPDLNAPIVSIATNGDTVVVATRDRMVIRTGSGERGAGSGPPRPSPMPGSGEQGAESGVTSAECRVQSGECEQQGWFAERVISVELGDLTSVAVDRDGVWVGGTRGIAHYQIATRAFVFFNAPGDVPGPVLDLATDEQYLWVATERGLVRFVKAALR
jgi:hypothetical protein